MTDRSVPDLTVRPFSWSDWRDLWVVRRLQLVEDGLPFEQISIPEQPALPGEVVYEWDFHHIDQVYLRGAGQFWIARIGEQPVGYVGAQDRAAVIELRRMFVHAPFRRRGIGAALVHTLLGHCRAHAVPAVELWTAPAGMGAALYRACGFRLIARPPGPLMLSEADYWPDPDEIRMRYDLGAHDARGHAPLHL